MPLDRYQFSNITACPAKNLVVRVDGFLGPLNLPLNIRLWLLVDISICLPVLLFAKSAKAENLTTINVYQKKCESLFE
jgi:hypothetical protein